MRRVFLFLIIFISSVLTGCKDTLPVKNAVISYFNAVQKGETGLLRDVVLVLDNPEAGDKSIMIENIYSEYEVNRFSGKMDFDPYGIKLIKILGLGRGTYYTFSGVIWENNRISARIKATTAYDKIRIDDLPQGTVFFFMGCPFGKVEQFEFEWGAMLDGELLSEIDIHIKMKENPVSPLGYSIISVRADENSAICRNVNRKFEYPF